MHLLHNKAWKWLPTVDFLLLVFDFDLLREITPVWNFLPCVMLHPKSLGSWIFLDRGLPDEGCSAWAGFTLPMSSGALGVWGSSWVWERQSWVCAAAPGMCLCVLCVSWCQPTLSPLGSVFSGMTPTELSPSYVYSLQLFKTTLSYIKSSI